MYSIILVAVTSFLLALLFTPICRNAFRSFGVVDRPDLNRKLHAAPTPRAGGVAIALAYVLSFCVLLLLPLQGKTILIDGLPLVLRLLPAAAVVFATGLLDDTLGLRPWQKLFGECVAALLAFFAGIQIHAIGDIQSSGEWWSLPLTVLWLLACTNAFNLIDGMDGLAAGVGVFAAMTTLAAAMIQNHVPLALATAPLVGALLGFLRYNFQPASVFLGDTGSLLIGFLLGCYAVLWSHKVETLFGMTAPIMVLFLPLLDTSLAIVRRFIRQVPIFAADRGHIHHRLLDRGLSPRQVAALIYMLCSVTAVFSLTTSFVRDTFAGLILLAFCGAAVLCVHRLRYIEFSLLGRVVSRGTVLHIVNAEMILVEFEKQMEASTTLDDQWTAVRSACKALGFSRVRLWIEDRVFEDRFANVVPADTCVLRILLAGDHYAECERSLDSPSGELVLAPFARILRRRLVVTPDGPEDRLSARAASL